MFAGIIFAVSSDLVNYLAGIPGSPAAFYHFLMDAARSASHVTIKKCQRTWLAGERSKSG